MLNSNNFRSRINDARERSSIEAFNFLEQSSPASAVQSMAYNPDEDKALNAFGASSSMAQQGLNWQQGFGSALGGIQAQSAARGLDQVGQAASFAQKMETENKLNDIYKDQAEDQQRSSTIGSIIGAVGSIATIFCERRLKHDIAPIQPDQAWATVRDRNLYSFSYNHLPGITAYGPMVDEVQTIDPSLVVSMDHAANAAGIADGKPINGVDLDRSRAYEATALQLALQRIEALENRLALLSA